MSICNIPSLQRLSIKETSSAKDLYLNTILIFDLLYSGIIQRLKEEFPLTPSKRKNGQTQLEQYIVENSQRGIASDLFLEPVSPDIISKRSKEKSKVTIFQYYFM